LTRPPRTLLARLPKEFTEQISYSEKPRKRGGGVKRFRLTDSGFKGISARLRGILSDFCLSVEPASPRELLNGIEDTLRVADDASMSHRENAEASGETGASLESSLDETIKAAEFGLQAPEPSLLRVSKLVKPRVDARSRRTARLRSTLDSLDAGRVGEAGSATGGESVGQTAVLKLPLSHTGEYAVLGVESLTARDVVVLPGGPKHLLSSAPDDRVATTLAVMARYALEKLPVS